MNMSMTANKVLDRAEELGMLDPKVIEELRRQVSESKFVVSAEAIVKVLVDKKHLTQFQAKKLVAEVTTEPEPVSPATQQSSAKSTAKRPPDSEDDLLANFGGPAPAAPTPQRKADDEDIVDLEAALPPAQPLKAEVKPLVPGRPASKKPEAASTAPPGSKPPAFRGTPPKTPPPGLTPLGPAGPQPSGLTPLAPSPAAPLPGLTPLGPTQAPVPGLTPLNPVDRTAPSPGLAPLSQGASPGLSPLGNAPTAPQLMPLGGPGDPLLGDPMGGLGGFGPPPPPKEEKASGVKKKLARGWDSPLLLMGGGGLGVLIIIFVVLYLALTRGTAQDLLADANKKYSEGQYATAIGLYERFVKSYPEESGVSSARLMIRASRIHQSYDAKDMNNALKTAERELPEMEKEESFDEIRGELESILPTIADHFATSARMETNLKQMEEQVSLAHSAMKLVNNASYLPTARRTAQQARIDEILEKIRVAERTINQGKALADAMTRMQEKLAAGDIKAAYEERAKLLQNYPTLQSNTEVVKNTLAISQRERDLVTSEPQTQAAASDDPHRAMHRQLLLARRGGDPIGAPENSSAFLLVRGTVYAIDVASGKIQWHRAVGAQARIQPLALPGGDVVVSDSVHRDVLRLAGATGKVIWRQSFGEGFAAPQALGDFLFVTLASGRIVRLSAATGELDRAAQLPQTATVAAGPDSRGKVLYQPAEHSTLYALAADDSAGEPLMCRSAFYLGHPPGSIAVPPIVVVGYVFVFQNEGAASSLVHALGVKKDGSLEAARDPVRLRGRVTIPPVSLRSRLIAVTDLGDTLVADIDPGNTDSPVNITAQKTGDLSQPTIGYPVVSGTRLFVADNRLAEYEIIATQQKLENRQSSFAGDAFVAPLQLFGNTMVHARQRGGAKSVTVTGVNLSDNKSWQTVLSAPIVGVSAFPEQRQFAALSSDGDLFEVGVDSFKDAVRDQSSSTVSGTAAQNFSDPVSLPDGKSLYWTRSGRAWAVQETRAGGAIQRVSLQADEGDSLSARPAPFAGGILAPLTRGAVWLLDAATGAPLAGTTPFLPETMPGAKSHWLPPLVVDERQFVAVDAARKTVYLARREEKPSPFLAQSRLLEVDYEPAYAALLDKSLLIVARGATEDEIVALSLPALQETKRLKLQGRVGPRGLEIVGNQVFCQTSSGDLQRISPALEVAAQTKLDSPLVSPPLAAGNDWLLVAQSGQVLRMAGESGELQVVADAGQPLTGAVQLLGSSLLAGGANGVLHVLPLGGAAKEEQR